MDLAHPQTGDRPIVELLIMSSFVMGVSLLLLGICLYSHSYHSLSVLSDCDWLPMICIVSYMVAAPMGLCSIPFIYIAEFYPSEVNIYLHTKLLYSEYL